GSWIQICHCWLKLFGGELEAGRSGQALLRNFKLETCLGCALRVCMPAICLPALLYASSCLYILQGAGVKGAGNQHNQDGKDVVCFRRRECSAGQQSWLCPGQVQNVCWWRSVLASVCLACHACSMPGGKTRAGSGRLQQTCSSRMRQQELCGSFSLIPRRL
ncbi:hypothetical protein NPIL_379511, partial [Nephila pilipes]